MTARNFWRASPENARQFSKKSVQSPTCPSQEKRRREQSFSPQPNFCASLMRASLHLSCAPWGIILCSATMKQTVTSRSSSSKPIPMGKHTPECSRGSRTCVLTSHQSLISTPFRGDKPLPQQPRLRLLRPPQLEATGSATVLLKTKTCGFFLIPTIQCSSCMLSLTNKRSSSPQVKQR